MSLPSQARHRWVLDDGGEVGYLDLGGVVILIPGDVEDLKQQLLEAITDEDWDLARQGFGDRELANE
jgi:hypothetical protein